MTRTPRKSSRRRHALTAIGLALFACAAPASAQTTSAHLREARGTWVSTTNLTASGMATAADTTVNFRRLRNIGLNTIYIDAFRNGATYFNSPTLGALTGSNMALGTRDLLAETTLQARRNQMAPVAWFQYGFMASFEGTTAKTTPNGSTLATVANQRGWLLRDASGNVNSSSQQFAWMNPAVPEVRKLLVDMAVETVRNYNVAGIQFDDHTAWPVNFGFDQTTRNLFAADNPGVTFPTNSSSPTWGTFSTWRTSKLTLFFNELSTAVRAVRPTAIISISPSPIPTATSSFLADWPAWVKAGLLDEYVPQVYRSGFTNFQRDWSTLTNGQTQYFGPVASGNNPNANNWPVNTPARFGDAVAGMAIDTSGTTISDVTQSISLVRSTPGVPGGVAGHAIWYANGVYANEATLTSFYNVAGVGQAARPDTGPLPAPIVATSLGNNQWQITISGGQGVFDLLAGSSNVWRVEQSRLLLGEGTHTFTVANATAVELLVTNNFFVVPEPRLAGVLPLFALATRRPRRRAGIVS